MTEQVSIICEEFWQEEVLFRHVAVLADVASATKNINQVRPFPSDEGMLLASALAALPLVSSRARPISTLGRLEWIFRAINAVPM